MNGKIVGLSVNSLRHVPCDMEFSIGLSDEQIKRGDFIDIKLIYISVESHQTRSESINARVSCCMNGTRLSFLSGPDLEFITDIRMTDIT